MIIVSTLFQDLRYCSIPVCVLGLGEMLRRIRILPLLSHLRTRYFSLSLLLIPVFITCIKGFIGQLPQDDQDRKASTAVPVIGQPRVPRQDNQVGKISLNYISDSAFCDLSIFLTYCCGRYGTGTSYFSSKSNYFY